MSTEQASMGAVISATKQIAPSLEAYSSIGDVEVPLLAELDHRTISADELMRLEEGKVITLLRPAGENIDLFVGDVLLASAEILVMDHKLAVRVAELNENRNKASR